MIYRPPSRGFRSPNRGLWTLLIVMLVVLAVSCFAGLLVSIAQRGGEPASSGSSAATGSAGAAPGQRAVPELIGVRLSDAEDRLKALGFDDPRIEDATGRDRAVLSRQNWIVRGQDPKAGSRVADSTRITLRVSKPTDAAPTGAPTDGVIPDVVCRDLQAAQDALQAAGFFVLDSVDGTGQGRRQLVDRNWVVVKQSVAPGTRPVRSTRVLLTAVKIGEPTDRCDT